jgi:hypothetical protein
VRGRPDRYIWHQIDAHYYCPHLRNEDTVRTSPESDHADDIAEGESVNNLMDQRIDGENIDVTEGLSPSVAINCERSCQSTVNGPRRLRYRTLNRSTI